MPESERIASAKRVLSTLIGAAIDRRNYTQRQAAAVLGIQQPAVNRIVRGTERIELARLVQHAGKLGYHITLTITDADERITTLDLTGCDQNQ